MAYIQSYEMKQNPLNTWSWNFEWWLELFTTIGMFSNVTAAKTGTYILYKM
jgi:hypothetical protein